MIFIKNIAGYIKIVPIQAATTAAATTQKQSSVPASADSVSITALDLTG